jgi:glycosyltransferase involved in cell wall biosynthesis
MKFRNPQSDIRNEVPQSAIRNGVKVALLGPYPGDAHLAGGVDAVVLALAQGLARRPGVELHVVDAAPGLSAPRVEPRTDLTLWLVPHPRGDRLLWRQPVVRQLRRALAEIRPDVVHAHMTGFHADAALRSGRPAVITPHGVIFRETALALCHSPLPARMRWRLDAWYERWVIHRARDLIAISPYIAKEYRPLTAGRFHDIENPVADRFFEVPAEDASGSPAGSRLLYVARVIPRKDILTLLGAFAAVRQAIPDAILEIAGQTDADPPYMAACRETVERLGLGESVHFLGDLHGPALVACYARANLVLLTSRQETAPVTVAEAMAAGRAVVATRVGGVPYMIEDGENGLLAEAGDADAVARAAIALLADRERRLAYGRAARAAAERRFRLDAIVDRTLALYGRLIAEWPP